MSTQQFFHPSVQLYLSDGQRCPAVFGSCIYEQLQVPRNEDGTFPLVVPMHARYEVTSPDASVMHLTLAGASEHGGAGEADPASVEEKGPLVMVAHAPHCPVMLKPVIPAPVGTQLRVAAAILLVSRHNRVLLTRRAATMRTFPRVWVVPGGHVEKGESLEAAGAREMYEETGVRVDPSRLQLFAAWESVSPAYIEEGTPQRQHFVAYMKFVDTDGSVLQGTVQSNRNPQEEANANNAKDHDADGDADDHKDDDDGAINLRVQRSEVDMTTWMDADLFALVSSEHPDQQHRQRNTTFTAHCYENDQDSNHDNDIGDSSNNDNDDSMVKPPVTCQLPVADLLPPHPPRLSTGTRYILGIHFKAPAPVITM